MGIYNIPHGLVDERVRVEAGEARLGDVGALVEAGQQLGPGVEYQQPAPVPGREQRPQAPQLPALKGWACRHDITRNACQ
jgi:hypothetical protein